MLSNRSRTRSFHSGTVWKREVSGARLGSQTVRCFRCDRSGPDLSWSTSLFSYLFSDHYKVRLCFVSNGLEELRGFLVPFVDLSVHLLCPLGDKTLFDFTYKPCSDAFPLMLRLYREVVDPASPSVPSTYHAAHDHILQFSDQEQIWVSLEFQLDFLEFVSRTKGQACGSPEVPYSLVVVYLEFADLHDFFRVCFVQASCLSRLRAYSLSMNWISLRGILSFFDSRIPRRNVNCPAVMWVNIVGMFFGSTSSTSIDLIAPQFCPVFISISLDCYFLRISHTRRDSVGWFLLINSLHDRTLYINPYRMRYI